MKNTSIEWCDMTFNPWQGCTKVSPGCAHCYAESLSKRWGKDTWGAGKERVRTSEGYWRQPLAWDRESATLGKRKRVFCASMADVFDSSVPYEWRYDLFELIERTPNLDWLLLTKRPGNIHRMISATAVTICEAWYLEGQPPENVWLGVSIEDQSRADHRIPALLKIPSVVHFLSVEPLLEPVDLGNISDIEWVICGGESGARARPMNPEWPLLIRDQCVSMSVPFFFKQWGGRTPKAGGRELEGRTWDQMP
jgi:protein gp37